MLLSYVKFVVCMMSLTCYWIKRSPVQKADIRNSPLTAYRLGKAKRVALEEGTNDKRS